MLLLMMMMMMLVRDVVEELSSMGVRLRLYGCERMRRERLIGECIVSFASLPAALDYPLEQWLTLEPRSNLCVRPTHSIPHTPVVLSQHSSTAIINYAFHAHFISENKDTRNT